MSYFNFFPKVNYKFGDETTPDVITNISLYSSVVDELRENVSFYFDYTVPEFERPDQTSFKLYGTSDYYWTFYMLNDHIRERGWALTNRELIEKIRADYPDTVITTKTSLTDRFKVGQTITGNITGISGTIRHRNLDLGQLVITNITGTFQDGETVSSTNTSGVVETIVVDSSSLEYLAAHHYENADKEYVDIDPSVGPGALLTEITYEDRYIAFNEELKDIRIIKPDLISQVVRAFREAMRS